MLPAKGAGPILQVNPDQAPAGAGLPKGPGRRVFGTLVPALGIETFGPWLATQNLGPVARFGIAHDDPSLVPPEQCRYDCGVVVPDGWVPNGGALVTELPGGRYAVLNGSLRPPPPTTEQSNRPSTDFLKTL